MEYTKEQIGMFLRKGREAITPKLTQEKFAEIMECNATYYGNIERGINYPSLPLFLKMVSYLDISVDNFIVQSENINTDTHQQLLLTLNQCTEAECRILLEIARTLMSHRKDMLKEQNTL